MSASSSNEQGVSRWHAAISVVCEGVPVLLVLAFFVVLLHAQHVLHVVDGPFLRHAVERYLHDRSERDDYDFVLPEVGLIEVDALTRLRELDSDVAEVANEDLLRVGGVRPIDRAQAARLIDLLADRIERIDEQTTRRPVVVLDFEFLPLNVPEGRSDRRAREAEVRVARAVQRLAAATAVVAPVLTRPAGASRQRRNAFMAAGGDAGVRCATRIGAGPVRGLYFGSPRLFHDPGSFPLDFPTRTRDDPTQWFPSLGNLAAALALDPQAHATWLVAICRQAHGEPGAPLLEDRIDACAGGGCADGSWDERGSEWRRLAWHRLNLLGATQINRLDMLRRLESGGAAGEAVARLDDEWFSRRILVVGIDGGRDYDKFAGATATGATVSGSTLHALAALSSLHVLRDRGDAPLLRDASAVGVVFDLAVGGVFLVAWAGYRALVQGARERWPFLYTLAMHAGPAAIGGLLGWWVLEVGAPRLLDDGLWANPAYVLLGLAAHAYLEAWHGPEPHASHGAPDLSFGLDALVRRPAGAGPIRDGWLKPVVAWGIVVTGLVVVGVDEPGPALVIAAVIVALAVASHISRRPKEST